MSHPSLAVVPPTPGQGPEHNSIRRIDSQENLADVRTMGQLKRRLNLIDALAITLGAVIGVGVFRNTGLVLRGTGGFVEATALWLVIGLLCIGGASLYADLSGRVPEAGGQYAFVRTAFGGRAAFIYGWLYAGVSLPARQAAAVAIAGEVMARWVPVN